MSKKIINEVRESKPFKRGDIIVYISLILVVFFLFLFFTIIPYSSDTDSGFKIYVNGIETARFYYSSLRLEIVDKESVCTFELNEKKTVLTVYFDNEKTQYNVLSIDPENQSVKVSNANCSVSKDCTFSPPVKNNGAIVCVPHKLKITPLYSNEIAPPVTGGLS